MASRDHRKIARIAMTWALTLLVFGIIPVVIGGGEASSSLFLALFMGANLLGGVFLGAFAILVHRKGVGEILRSRSSRMTSGAVLYSFFAIGILVVLNVLAIRHGSIWDFTEEGRFTLSEQSQKIVGEVSREVEIRAFYRKGTEGDVEALLDLYARAGDSIRVRFIDPMREPALARRFDIVDEGTVHVASGGEQVRITGADEEKITNAILKVTQGDEKVVYVLGGHGEAKLDDAATGRGHAELARALEGENYRVEELLLMSRADVPPDATVVIAPGAVRPYFPEEIAALERYLEGGGRLLALLEPSYDATTGSLAKTGLEDLLRRHGIEVGNNLVLDLELRVFAGPQIGVAPGADGYGMHEITEDLTEVTFFENYVREVEPSVGHAGATVTTLVRTSATSWAESDLAGIFEEQEASRDALDTGGPISVAVAFERETLVEGREEAASGDGQTVLTRIVAFGDAGFVDNAQLLQVKANEDLVLNSVAWLADRGELISIRPRRATASALLLTPEQTRSIFVLSVFLLPELILLAGLFVWQRRR